MPLANPRSARAVSVPKAKTCLRPVRIGEEGVFLGVDQAQPGGHGRRGFVVGVDGQRGLNLLGGVGGFTAGHAADGVVVVGVGPVGVAVGVLLQLDCGQVQDGLQRRSAVGGQGGVVRRGGDAVGVQLGNQAAPFDPVRSVRPAGRRPAGSGGRGLRAGRTAPGRPRTAAAAGVSVKASRAKERTAGFSPPPRLKKRNGLFVK